MSNRKVTSIAFTGAAAVLAASIGALPAHAASSWHIKNGGTGYTGLVRGKNTTSVVLTSSHGTSLICLPGHVTVSGSMPESNVAGKPATLTDLSRITFTSCSIGGIRINGTGTASLIVSNYNAGTSGTTGKLGNFHLTLAGSGNNCKVTVTGQFLPASYVNAALTFDPTGAETLNIESVTGCGGLTAGAKAALTGTIRFSTPAALAISFP